MVRCGAGAGLDIEVCGAVRCGAVRCGTTQPFIEGGGERPIYELLMAL